MKNYPSRLIELISLKPFLSINRKTEGSVIYNQNQILFSCNTWTKSVSTYTEEVIKSNLTGGATIYWRERETHSIVTSIGEKIGIYYRIHMTAITTHNNDQSPYNVVLRRCIRPRVLERNKYSLINISSVYCQPTGKVLHEVDKFNRKFTETNCTFILKWSSNILYVNVYIFFFPLRLVFFLVCLRGGLLIQMVQLVSISINIRTDQVTQTLVRWGG